MVIGQDAHLRISYVMNKMLTDALAEPRGDTLLRTGYGCLKRQVPFEAFKASGHGRGAHPPLPANLPDSHIVGCALRGRLRPAQRP